MKNKLDFFNNKISNTSLTEGLLLYILSLLDKDNQKNVAEVNNQWHQCIKFLNLLQIDLLTLLSTIQRIPSLQNAKFSVSGVKLLAGGMTNCTFKLEPENSAQHWVLRIPGQGSSAFITRKDEAHNAKCAAELGLNVPIAFMDPDDGLQLTSFIQGAHELDGNALERKELLYKLASMLRQLHTSETSFANDVSVFSQNESLVNGLKNKEFKLSDKVGFIEEQMIELAQLFSPYQIPKNPCHNDVTPSNFLMTSEGSENEKIYLIDWEYSSNNDFLWDLVYFSLEAKLSETQENMLLTAYFGENEVTKDVQSWFTVYKPIIEWWITLWAWTQLANKANAVDEKKYQELGENSYKKTLSFLESNEFKRACTSIDQAEKGKRSFSLI